MQICAKIGCLFPNLARWMLTEDANLVTSPFPKLSHSSSCACRLKDIQEAPCLHPQLRFLKQNPEIHLATCNLPYPGTSTIDQSHKPGAGPYFLPKIWKNKLPVAVARCFHVTHDLKASKLMLNGNSNRFWNLRSFADWWAGVSPYIILVNHPTFWKLFLNHPAFCKVVLSRTWLQETQKQYETLHFQTMQATSLSSQISIAQYCIFPWNSPLYSGCMGPQQYDPVPENIIPGTSGSLTDQKPSTISFPTSYTSQAVKFLAPKSATAPNLSRLPRAVPGPGAARPGANRGAAPAAPCRAARCRAARCIRRLWTNIPGIGCWFFFVGTALKDQKCKITVTVT